jgi:hypothetical protein
MIPSSTFNLGVAVALLLLIYSVADNRNSMYANISLSVVSGILFLYLGQAITIGAVEFTSKSFGDILGLFGFVAFGYAVFMATDAIFESINSEANKMPTGEQEGEVK